MAKKKLRKVPPSPADFSSALSGYEKESREAKRTRKITAREFQPSCADSTKINGQRLRSHLPCSDFVTKTTLLKVGVLKTLEFAHNPKHAFIEGKAGMLFVPAFSLLCRYVYPAQKRAAPVL
jgi:hypothetical protein